jgi:hypothetical protein
MFDQILSFIPAHEAQLLALFGATCTALSLFFGLFTKTVQLSKIFGAVSPADLIRIWKYIGLAFSWLQRWRAARKVVNGLITFGVIAVLFGCSLESARYNRAARSSFEENVKMAQSTRPAEWCQKVDNWHVGLEIGGGVVVAPIGAAAGIVAAADTSDKIENIAIGVGLGALAVETAILAADGKLVSVWTEQGCGQ